MGILVLVAALAAAWHFGLALFERHRRRELDRPSLARLLVLAEVELLRTLHGELKRQMRLRSESRCERKLDEVERRLKELDVHGSGNDIGNSG